MESWIYLPHIDANSYFEWCHRVLCSSERHSRLIHCSIWTCKLHCFVYRNLGKLIRTDNSPTQHWEGSYQPRWWLLKFSDSAEFWQIKFRLEFTVASFPVWSRFYPFSSNARSTLARSTHSLYNYTECNQHYRRDASSPRPWILQLYSRIVSSIEQYAKNGLI